MQPASLSPSPSIEVGEGMAAAFVVFPGLRLLSAPRLGNPYSRLADRLRLSALCSAIVEVISTMWWLFRRYCQLGCCGEESERASEFCLLDYAAGRKTWGSWEKPPIDNLPAHTKTKSMNFMWKRTSCHRGKASRSQKWDRRKWLRVIFMGKMSAPPTVNKYIGSGVEIRNSVHNMCTTA
jgi:hypothetical protein